MTTYKTGDLVWAKMKGFPKWPGVVAEPTRELKATRKANCHCIYFFGSCNYAWIEPKALDPYNDASECKTKSGAFKDAVAAIENYKLTGEGGPPTVADDGEEDPFDELFKEGEASTSGSGKKKSSGKKRRLSKESETASTDGESSSKSAKVSRKSVGTPKTGRPKKSLEGSLVKKRKTENRAADTTTGTIRVNRKTLIDRPTFQRAESPTLDLTTVSQTLLNKRVVPSDKVFGFIGLGVMGSGIVKNLLNSRHEVHVWDRVPDRSQEFARVGAKLCMTPQDVMCAADIVFCCVSDPEVAKSMVFGNCGVLPEANNGKAYVEMSGIDAETSKLLNTTITEAGGRYMEAQLQGSKAEAEEGTLVILAAGDRSVYNEVGSCFEAICRASFFLGEIGTATRMNLIIQQLFGVVVAGLAEALAVAERCSINQHEFLEVLGMTCMSCPLLQEKGRAMADCTLGTSMAIKYVQKDMDLALTMAKKLDQPTPVTAIAHNAYVHAKRFGYSDHDAASVYITARF